jgi:hypothetical protein
MSLEKLQSLKIIILEFFQYPHSKSWARHCQVGRSNRCSHSAAVRIHILLLFVSKTRCTAQPASAPATLHMQY